MAHEVLFFCNVRSASAADFAEDLRSAISDGCEGAVFGPQSVGDSWVERDVWSPGSDAPISLGCHLGGPVLEMEVRRVQKEPGGQAIAGSNALIKSTLSGPVDWELFEVIWHAAEDQFSAIPYDEDSGFEASLA